MIQNKFLCSFICMGGLILAASSSKAQHSHELYNDGAVIHIQAGAEVHVLGDVHMLKSTGTLENNGLLKVQGNLYSDNLFQQRGTGTTRLENSAVNTMERQFISGSYAVRGGQSQIGVNDGSFYNLELANSQGVTYLVGTGNVADVRGSIDFRPDASIATNNIVTHDVGLTGVISYPANGSNYSAVFGMMNNAHQFVNFSNSTKQVYGNNSPTDLGYIIGKHRRAINPNGGTYGFQIGLEPAGGGVSRGFQYIRFIFGAGNTYDVLSGYFQQGSSNAATSATECNNYDMNYFGGADHGEWIFDDINNVNGGLYDVKIWPQDDNFASNAVWTISKDDVFAYASAPLQNDCGPSPSGLDRYGFNGFSQFGVVGSNILLNNVVTSLDAIPVQNNFIQTTWSIDREQTIVAYQLERSTDDMNFIGLTTINAKGMDNAQYLYNDRTVWPNQHYYYRVKLIHDNGDYDYTKSVNARITRSKIQHGSIKLYPNPVHGETVYIETEQNTARAIELNVFNTLGQHITHKSHRLNAGVQQIALSTKDWPAGVYTVQVLDKTTQSITTKEFVKSNY
jgi:hypothetical protein